MGLAAPAQAETSHAEQEVVSARTATSQTFLRSDGTRRVSVSSVPIAFKSGGEYRLLDPELKASAAGFQPRAVSFGLTLPRSLGDATPTTLRSGAAELSFSLRGARGKGRAEGNTAVYPAALDGAEVRLTSQPSGVEDAVVFAAPGDVDSVTYDLTWSGVKPRFDRPTLTLLDGDRVIFTVGAATLADSADPPHVSDSLRVVFRRLDATHGTLTVKPDAAFLARRDLVAPIVLDPPFTVSGTSTECRYAESNSESSGEGIDATCGGILTAGTEEDTYEIEGRDSDCLTQWSAYREEMVLLRFALPAGLDRSTKVLRATVSTYGAPITRVERVTTAWTPSTLNSSLGRDLINTPFSTTGGTTKTDITYQPDGVNLVDDWLRDPTKNHGLLLRNPNPNYHGINDCQSSAGRVNEVHSDTRAAVSNSTDVNIARRPTLELIVAPKTGTRPFDITDPHPVTTTETAAVDVASGNLIVRRTDAELSADLPTGQVYNSQADAAGSLGLAGPNGGAWTTAAAPDVRLELPTTNSGVILHDASGRVIPIAPGSGSGAGQYREPEGLDAQLTHTTGYTLTYADGATLSFDLSGRLALSQDATGHAIAYYHASDGKLATLQSSDGRFFSVTYSAGRITSVYQTDSDGGSALPGGLTRTYAYDGLGRLQTYTDNTGTTTYSYDAAGRLAGIAAPGGVSETITYANGKVATLSRTASTGSYTFTYSYGNHKTTATPTSGLPSTFYYDGIDKVYAPDVNAPVLTAIEPDPASYFSSAINVPFRADDDRSGVLQVTATRDGGTAVATLTGTNCLHTTQIPGWDSGSGVTDDCDRSRAINVPTSSLSEGPVTLSLTATDGAGHTSAPVEAPTVYVDKTGPPAVTNIQGVTDAWGRAELSWTPVTDPLLADGSLPSGIKEYQVRYDSVWNTGPIGGEPEHTVQPALSVTGLSLGTSWKVEVTPVDNAGNRGTPVTTTVTLGANPNPVVTGLTLSSGTPAAGTATWQVSVPGGGAAESCLIVRGPGISTEVLSCTGSSTSTSRSVTFDLEDIVDFIQDGDYTFSATAVDSAGRGSIKSIVRALDRVPADGIGPIDLDPEYGVDAGEPVTVLFGAGEEIVGEWVTVEMRDDATDAVLDAKNVVLGAVNRVKFTSPTADGDIYFRVSTGGAQARGAAAGNDSRRVAVASASQLAKGPAWYVWTGSLPDACRSGKAAARIVTKDDSLVVIQFGTQDFLARDGVARLKLAREPALEIPIEDMYRIANEFARCYISEDNDSKLITMVLTVSNDNLKNGPRDGDPVPVVKDPNAQPFVHAGEDEPRLDWGTTDWIQGRDWAGGVKKVQRCLEGHSDADACAWNAGHGDKTGRVKVSGGFDAEIEYSSQEAAVAWYEGYISNNSDAVNLLDIGDAAGCAQATSTHPCNAYGKDQPTDRKWSLANRSKIAWWGAVRTYAAPQMYFNNQVPHWRKVNEEAKKHSRGTASPTSILFSGATSGGFYPDPNNVQLPARGSWQALKKVASSPDRLQPHVIDYKKPTGYAGWGELRG